MLQWCGPDGAERLKVALLGIFLSFDASKLGMELEQLH